MSVGLSFVIGIASGIVAGTIVGLLFLSYEVRFSTAVYRVGKVAEATRNIVNTNSRGELRNEYRFYLAVIIDRLDRTFGKVGKFERDRWPPLVHHTDEEQPQLANRHNQPDPEADRWDFFELYIRPVAEDIGRFSHVSKYPCLWKTIQQLRALTNLCNELENVVCRLDAAFEAKGLVELKKVDDAVIVRPTPSANKRVDGLRKSYEGLHTAWREWLHAVGVI